MWLRRAKQQTRYVRIVHPVYTHHAGQPSSTLAHSNKPATRMHANHHSQQHCICPIGEGTSGETRKNKDPNAPTCAPEMSPCDGGYTHEWEPGHSHSVPTPGVLGGYQRGRRVLQPGALQYTLSTAGCRAVVRTTPGSNPHRKHTLGRVNFCLLYTSDAADE